MAGVEIEGPAIEGAKEPSPGGRGPIASAWSVPIVRAVIVGVVIFAVAYIILGRLSPYRNLQISEAFVYVIAVAGLSLLTGQNGQISLGHGAIMMLGAYTTALLSVHFSLAYPWEILASIVVGIAVGCLIGVVAARLRGPYLAGFTLALALALPSVAEYFSSVSGGDAGLIVNQPVPPNFLGANFTIEEYGAVIGLILVIGTYIFLSNLLRSKEGRNFRVVRDDEVAAQISGISVSRTQIKAFIVSSACAGLAGSLYALINGSVAPAGFTIALSIQLLTAMVLGGIGSIYGAIAGGVVLVYAPSWTNSLSNSLNLTPGVSANLSLAIFGLLLVVLMITFDRGLAGALQLLWRRARSMLSKSRRVPTGATETGGGA